MPKVSTWQYEPYLNPAPLPSPATSVKAALTIAAHNVMTAYFPAAAPALDAARDTDLAAIPPFIGGVGGTLKGLAVGRRE